MTYKRILAVLALLTLSAAASAQIEINFPVERMVFQRNTMNLGTINIFGTVAQDCDRVEARLLARNGNQGGSTDWISIDNAVDGQAYSGKIVHQGGWYTLEVRGIRNNNELFRSTLERVGIGEVFVIAGQSNAQGYGVSPNAKGANDDRVNGYLPNYFAAYTTDQYRNFPEILSEHSFGKIGANTNIGPTGYTAYCWGELGDKLVQRLNVPVLFFNAAFSGTSTSNWVESAQGNQTYNLNFGNALENGAPYRGLRVTLQSFNALVGIRAILWHQGEHERFANGGAGVTARDYFNNMNFLINKTRSDIGENLPWVVARASYYNDARFPKPPAIRDEVIQGQNMVISGVPNVFAGPSTDGIQTPRYDGGHFQNRPGSEGLSDLASAWNDALTEAFFNAAPPVFARDVPKLMHNCADGSNVRLYFNNIYREYHWNTGHTGGDLYTQGGRYQVTLRDQTGNVYRSSVLNVSDVFVKTVPVLSTPDGLVGCEGKEVRLVAPASKYTVEWNTGFNGDVLQVRNPGTFSARYRSNSNCYSNSTQNFSVSFKAPPAKPQLMFLNGGGYKCDGDNITVAITNVQGADIKWNTGATSNQITLSDNSLPFVSATLYSLPNCPSPTSDELDFEFYPNPGKPTLSYNGPFYLRASSPDPEVTYDWSFTGTKIDGEASNLLHLQQPGNYQVKGIRTYQIPGGGSVGCVSELSDVFLAQDPGNLTGFSLFPNPVSTGVLQITSDGERENVDFMVYDVLGREIYHTVFDKISYPRTVDLTSKGLQGKYFVRLKFEGQSKTYAIVFTK
jgi:hypothetical protein